MDAPFSFNSHGELPRASWRVRTRKCLAAGVSRASSIQRSKLVVTMRFALRLASSACPCVLPLFQCVNCLVVIVPQRIHYGRGSLEGISLSRRPLDSCLVRKTVSNRHQSGSPAGCDTPAPRNKDSPPEAASFPNRSACSRSSAESWGQSAFFDALGPQRSHGDREV